MDNRKEEIKTKNKVWLIDGLIVLAIFAIAFSLRVIPMTAAVFGSSWVNIQGPDSVYHLRLVENLLHHFPFRIAFDPYTFFPTGQDVFFAPLYDYIGGFAAWVLGLGSPTQHLIETVASFVPAVFGGLVTTVVYFIAKALWNRTAGLTSALIVGILPGTLLYRSRLGYFDHHIAEVFFSTLFVLFLILTLRQANTTRMLLTDILHKNWKPYTKPLLFSCLAGIALGLYLLVWVGGLLFVFMFFAWAVVMFIIEHLRKQSTDYICLIGIPIFLLPLIMIIPFLSQIAYSELNVFSLLFGLFALIGLFAISKLMENKKLAQIFYPLSLLGLGIIGLIVLNVFFPAIATSIYDKFKVFNPNANSLTIAEVQPLFVYQGQFSLTKFWSEFTTGTIIAPIAFIILLVSVFRKFTPGKILMLLWSLMTFVAAAGQVRFTYYLAVSLALLCGYFYGSLADWIKLVFNRLFNKPDKKSVKIAESSRHHRKAQAKSATSKTAIPEPARTQSEANGFAWYKLAAAGLLVVIVSFAGIYPNVQPALAEAKANIGIDPQWRDALIWMKSNTPEPFQNADFFNQYYQTPPDNKYNYPESAYGVMAWWDYGHMITEIGHRIPNSNPTQAGAGTAASYFVSQNEVDANKLLDAAGSRYVIVDYDIASPYKYGNNAITGGKFYAMPTFAGTNPSSYSQVFYEQKGGNLAPVPVYFPEYYYCLSSRLFWFHGAAVVPETSSTVISFKQQSGINVIQTSQTFATYEEAKKFLDKQTTPNYRIVGMSPFSSPVPLEKLTHYKEVYRSQYGVTYNGQKSNSSYIEVFEYKP